MLTRRKLLCFTAVFAPFAVCAQRAKIDAAAIEAAAKAELEATLTPGAAIGIVQNGQLIYARGIGTRNAETGEPITAQTLFRLGSTTKMLTASAVASFAAEGKIDFADPVGKHISGLDSAIAALTVNQILSHTSGLKDEAVMNGRHDDAALGEEIRRWRSDWLFTKPGAIYSYANPGFWLAGFLAETVAGKPYADMMEERVFQPVGMTWTTVRPTMAMTRIFSQGHDMAGGHISVLRPAPDNAANWPAGSVFSNLADLSRFVIVLMNEGRIDGRQALSPKVVLALTTPHADVPGSAAKYGYGITIEGTGDHLTWSHSGSRAGYGSYIAMFPARKEAVIVLTNRTGQNLPRTRIRILSLLGLLKETDPPGAGSSIEPAEFSKYVGSYRNGAMRHEIVARDGQLLLDDREVRKTAAGWLVFADGGSRVFTVTGDGGRVEYLFLGGRAAARVP